MVIVQILIEVSIRVIDPVGEDDQEVAGDQDEDLVDDFDGVLGFLFVWFVDDGVADGEDREVGVDQD